ncbi:hypothetical protein D9M69_707120 [compost metagenome]
MAAPSSSIKQLSVSSMSSRQGSRLASLIARMNSLTTPLSFNWRADILMAIRMFRPSRFQAAACRAASRMTHMPSGEIRPDSSAYGMKASGPTMPRSGERQRTSASTPSTSPVRPASLGW